MNDFSSIPIPLSQLNLMSPSKEQIKETTLRK